MNQLLTMSDLFRDFSRVFFSVTESEISEQTSRQIVTEEPNFCKHAWRRNWRYYNLNRDENPLWENEMDSPSSEGFKTQLDCKLTHGNKNKT